MDWRRIFDFQTVLACQSLLAVVFALVFLGMGRVYPQVRGVRAIAISFLLIVPDALCVGLREHLSPVVSVMMADTLMLASLIAMYEAVVHFTGGANQRWLLWLTAFTSFAVVFFYTEVNAAAGPRIVAVALSMAVIRGFTAYSLLTRAQRSSQRWLVGFFGLFLAFLSVLSLYHAWGMAWHAGDFTEAQQSTEQNAMLATGMFYIAISGVCFLVLTSRELLAQRRMAGDWTPIDGTFNRVALEVNLAVELGRFEERRDPFCLAMLEIDAINALRADDDGYAAMRDAAETLSKQLRGTDRIGCFSRHEFVLFFASTGHTAAGMVAERCAEQVGRMRLQTGPMTLSIGISEAAAGDTAQKLMERAGLALAQAKAEGGGRCCVVLAEPGMATAAASTNAMA
jgi:diguanylate cyclase (GGDEF)-like protein